MILLSWIDQLQSQFVGEVFLSRLFFFTCRSHTSADDDLTTVRSILHTNMLLCLIIVQILFLFGIDQTKHKVMRETSFHHIGRNLSGLILVRLSGDFYITRLFPAGNHLLDVRGWHRVIDCFETCFQNRSNPSDRLFTLFIWFPAVDCLSFYHALRKNGKRDQSIVSGLCCTHESHSSTTRK